MTAQSPAFSSYLFAYFAGESSPHGEQVRFAVSEPEHPLHFTVLGGGAPLLRSSIGERGVRDPFLVRNDAIGGFHLIATDLSIFHDSDWRRATTSGSRSIVVWDSADLVHWSEPRLQEIAPENAGCAWAPEAFFVVERDEFMIVWSSPLFDPQDSERADRPHLVVLRSFTRDFRSFTEPEIYIDPGHSVIDTTFLEHAGVTYRFTKDERPRSAVASAGKHIYQEASPNGLLATDFHQIAEGIGSDVLEKGEGPIAVNSPDGRESFLLIDEFGGRGYIAFHSSDPSSGVWTPVAETALPPGARHGSLLPITPGEHGALLALA